MNFFYDEESGHYIVKNARIMFPNFAGEEGDYNAAGKRNFRLQIDKEFADELMERGVNVSIRPPRDDDDEPQYLIKIGIYRNSDVRILSGKAMTQLDYENLDYVDKEFRKGHVKSGEVKLEFHVSVNTKIKSSSPYLRLDAAIIPIGKSRLFEELDEEYYEEED